MLSAYLLYVFSFLLFVFQTELTNGNKIKDKKKYLGFVTFVRRNYELALKRWGRIKIKVKLLIDWVVKKFPKVIHIMSQF